MAGRSTSAGVYAISSVEIYSPSVNSWTAAANVPVGMTDHRLVVRNGEVLVFGGYDGYTSTTYSSVYSYDPSTNIWSTLSPMSIPRKAHTIALLQDGRVFIVAGALSEPTAAWNSTEIYDPAAAVNGSTTPGPPLNVGRVNHQMIQFSGDKFLVAGGDNECYGCTPNILTSAEDLNSTSGNWATAGPMVLGRTAYAAVLLANNNALLTGGTTPALAPTNAAELWTTSPALTTGTISVTTNLPQATFSIAGPGIYTGSGTSFTQANTFSGTYTVTFGGVSGYITPSTQTQNLSDGGTISFTGIYQPLPATQTTAQYGAPGGSSRNASPSFAEPVNTATGNYYFASTDLAVPAVGLALTFTRSYNSADSYSGPLGPGWTHSFNVLLVQNADNSVSIKDADGGVIGFTPSSGGGYTPSTPGVFDSLKKNGDGSFTLTRKDQTELDFSTAGQLLSVMDRNGNAQTLTYSAGNLTAITDTAGRSYTLSYDGNGHLTAVTDPIGRTLQYAYDALGRLISFQDATGATTGYAYDSNNRLISATDPRGNIYLQNTYDSQGRVIAQKNARNFTTTFAYNTPSSGTTTITDPLGNVTKDVLDAFGRLAQQINASGGTTSYTYDGNNLKLSVTDPLGRLQSFTYDANGNTLTGTDPAGKTSSFTYDSKNNLLSSTDRLGRKTTFTYDGNGNLLTTVDPAANTSSFTYDGFGQIVTGTNARSYTTSFQYDSAGDLTKATDANGGTVSMAYDTLGRLTSVQNQLGKTATRSYDADNRLLSVADPLNNRTQFQYDANGNLTKITDANGKQTQYAYDATNKLTQVTDAMGGITQYQYNGNTDLTAVTDAAGHTTAYGYDALRRLALVTDPLGRQRHYGYDAVGNITGTIDGQ